MKKGLGFIDVFCIAAGAMISSGIFVLPGLAFSLVGPAMIVSYLIAGMLALIGVFSVIELATAMPKAGGDYYFLTRSLGPLQLVCTVAQNGLRGFRFGGGGVSLERRANSIVCHRSSGDVLFCDTQY